MLVHSVYFWLRKDLSAQDIVEFRAGLESLRGIAAARAVHVGTPADTPHRPVIDCSYSVGLVVLLDGMDAHDAYQQDPLHQAFLARFARHWERVQIYDFD